MGALHQFPGHGPGVVYRGIEIRRFDVPCTPWVWTHCETDASDTAETLEEARAQIDRLLDRCEAQHG